MCSTEFLERRLAMQAIRICEGVVFRLCLMAITCTASICFGADWCRAGVIFRRPEDGRVREFTIEPSLVVIYVTDEMHERIPGAADGYDDNGQPINPWPRTAMTGSHGTATFFIPKFVATSGSSAGETVESVFDVEQEVTDIGNSGQVSNVSFEAITVDPSTGKFALSNIFAVIAEKHGFGMEILVPDLYADTNHDGILGVGDKLFSLVDLEVYLDSIPAFSLGDAFSVTNGLVPGLPGMKFSTTPFVFDPDNGFSGTDFSGEAFADSSHGLTAVPEPGALTMFGTGCLGMIGAAFYRNRRRTRANDLIAGRSPP